MNKTRKIGRMLKSRPTIEGAGVHLNRAFGNSQVPLFDPFLLLDDFRSDTPQHYLKGFPWHPHRGIETITYVLEGHVEHGDSMENNGDIRAGDVQWMTAGSGIIHQEMPKGDRGGRMGGFQLWANLPSSHKMMPPRYRDITASQIPTTMLDDGTKIKVICGRIGDDLQGPVRDIVIEPEYLDITVQPQTTYRHPVTPAHTVIVYVIEGKGYFGQEKKPFSHHVQGRNYFDMRREAFASDGTVILFDDGDHIEVSTEDEAVRFLFISGKPIGEPVAWYGPIVMNTQEELRIAFEEYQAGTFLKHKK